MRIAQVLCSLTSGGAEKLASDLTVKLIEKGHKVDIILIDEFNDSDFEATAKERLIQAGVKVYSLGRKPGSKYNIVRPLANLVDLMQNNKYEIIHSHLKLSHKFVGLAEKFLLRKPKHISTIHNSTESWSFLDMALARGCKIVFCSKASTKPIKDFCVIENGVDFIRPVLTDSEKYKLCMDLGIPPNAFTIISVGNLRAQKNYTFALNGIALLKKHLVGRKVQYLICGDGPEKDNLQKIITDLNLADTVQLLGSRSDVPKLLAISDCFLSTSSHEGLPLSVLEAFFSGVPCLLSDIPEHLAVAENIPGCEFFIRNNSRSFLEQISVLVDGDSEKELALERQAYLQKYRISECVLKYERFYNEVLS
ncbi:MAG: glycosyltransferase [Desulfobacteraceae bacterium]|nr:glycosyltransferase [Desulfobacteraceae bacterium]